MSNVAKLIKPEVNEDVVAVLRNALAEAEAGRLQGVVVIGEGKDEDSKPSYYRNTDFGDAWRMIGALEYAKAAVLKVITGG